MSDRREENGAVVENRWQTLRRFTRARIALGRAGVSLPTAAHLAFQRDHAAARDAVHAPVDFDAVEDALGLDAPAIRLASAAPDRPTYLARPDFGRRLDPASRAHLAEQAPSEPPDLALVIADGLSAQAVARHAAPLATAAMEAFRSAGLSLAPVVLVSQGRVAIGDEIGAALGARLVVVLIGERPGLSSPDSLGVYLTHAPRVGRSDAERNCISNIRPEGLPYAPAAEKLVYLAREALRRGETGVALKDEMAGAAGQVASGRNFLLPGAE